MTDLLKQVTNNKTKSNDYDAHTIEVLEGLEPVRKRPGMYIGGTDLNAMHHLIAEVFDNAMDEVVAGYASKIEVNFEAENKISIFDNGRGIPIDKHPKYPDKSALEVILSTLHAGGKFSNKAYQTSGGLHGVGISVVNALSKEVIVEVIREKELYRQIFSRGKVVTQLEKINTVKIKSGTKVTFIPDEQIFTEQANFDPEKLYKFIKAKAYLHKGVKINWSSFQEFSNIPLKAEICFENGIEDLLQDICGKEKLVIDEIFSGNENLAGGGRVEWCVAWPEYKDGELQSFCNTVKTPLGGTHVTGMRAALLKAVQNFANLHNKKNLNVTADDILNGSIIIISVFISEPQFQGQTKEKLVSREVSKQIEDVVKDQFEHFLTNCNKKANILLDFFIQKAAERISRRKFNEVNRKTILSKLRLPGKLTDCLKSEANDTEIFIVEGDSAGGSAKQARDRNNQAILPLKGKILNVASSSREKILANQEISDLNIALGCGARSAYDNKKLRYDKVIIMTDADVDGAHIASLLMTYFYKEMPDLIRNGHLFLAVPPLYRITAGGITYYANDEKERSEIINELEKKYKKIDMGRFKGLGEMTPKQLKETTMDPKKRSLYKVLLNDLNQDDASEKIDSLMGRRPELRFRFIQEQQYFSAKELTEDLNI